MAFGIFRVRQPSAHSVDFYCRSGGWGTAPMVLNTSNPVGVWEGAWSWLVLKDLPSPQPLAEFVAALSLILMFRDGNFWSHMATKCDSVFHGGSIKKYWFPPCLQTEANPDHIGLTNRRYLNLQKQYFPSYFQGQYWLRETFTLHSDIKT